MMQFLHSQIMELNSALILDKEKRVKPTLFFCCIFEFVGMILLIPPSVKCYAFASSPSRVEPKLAFPLRGEGVTVGDGRGANIPTNPNLSNQHLSSVHHSQLSRHNFHSSQLPFQVFFRKGRLRFWSELLV